MSFIIGRPWQFDLDVTHGGRSNTYSFVHKGVHHVLKLMLDSAIKAEVFAPVKVKKKATENIPKPRMALLQVSLSDVNVGSQIIVPANSCHLPKLATSIFEDHEIWYSSDSESACKIPEQASNKFGSLYF